MGAMAHALASSTATAFWNKQRIQDSEFMKSHSAQTAQLHCLGNNSCYPTRRALSWGLVGSLLSLSVSSQANAAKRRPPPQEETAKNDPNVSGVQAKVLASLKRKEAMKEAMAKLRERGKPINQPSSVGDPPQ